MKLIIKNLYLFIFLFSAVKTNAEVLSSEEMLCKISDGSDIHIKNVEFENNIDLTDMLDFSEVYPGEMKAFIKGNIIFEGCTFKDFIGFRETDNFRYNIQFEKNVIFKKCFFTGDFNISYATIFGDFSIAKSKIEGEFLLKNLWFRGRNADFSSMECFDKVKMTNSIFENNATFLHTKFHNTVFFQHAVFKGKAFFGASVFNEYAVFSNTTFLQKSVFSKAQFEKHVIFKYLSAYQVTEFNDVIFRGDADFSNSIFLGPVHFYGSIFEGKYITENTYFLIKPESEEL